MANRKPSQHWRNWGVRLGKVGLSLAWFGEMQLYNSARQFLLALAAQQRQGITINGAPIDLRSRFSQQPADELLLSH